MIDLSLLQDQFSIFLTLLIDPLTQNEVTVLAKESILKKLPDLAVSEQYMDDDGMPSPGWLQPGVYEIGVLESGFSQAWQYSKSDKSSTNGPATYMDRLPMHFEAVDSAIACWLKDVVSESHPSVYESLARYARDSSIPLACIFDLLVASPKLSEISKSSLVNIRSRLRESLLSCSVRLDDFQLSNSANSRLFNAMDVINISGPIRLIVEKMMQLRGERQFSFLRDSAGGHLQTIKKTRPGTILFSLDSFNRISLYSLSAIDILHRVDVVVSKDDCRIVILKNCEKREKNTDSMYVARLKNSEVSFYAADTMGSNKNGKILGPSNWPI